MKILLVEDNEQVAEVLTAALTEYRYIVDCAEDGQIAWEYIESSAYDLVILDVMLPKLDGIALCRKLRDRKNQTPVLMFSAKGTCEDKVLGLNAGADDYLVKPAAMQELIARVRALLRRRETTHQSILEWGELRLDPNQFEVSYGDYPLHLTPKEFMILEVFLRNSQRVFSRQTLLDQLWSFESAPSEETVKAHIKGLRQKLRAVGAGELIETVYGLGYRLNQQHQAQSSAEQAEKSRKLQAKIAKNWITSQPKLLDRIDHLSQLIQSSTEKHHAHKEAHKLVGSLSQFGLEQAAEIAQDLERCLQLAPDSGAPQTQLNQVQRLRMLVEQATLSNSVENLFQKNIRRTSDRVEQVLEESQNPAAKILAIADSSLVLEQLQTLLSPWGLETTSISQIAQFWQTLETMRPDLLIFDSGTSSLNSFELCQKIRSHGQWDGLPILFLTAKTDPETIHHLFEVGADDYIEKPIMAPVLVSRVFNRIKRIRVLHPGARSR